MVRRPMEIAGPESSREPLGYAPGPGTCSPAAAKGDAKLWQNCARSNQKGAGLPPAPKKASAGLWPHLHEPRFDAWPRDCLMRLCPSLPEAHKRQRGWGSGAFVQRRPPALADRPAARVQLAGHVIPSRPGTPRRCKGGPLTPRHRSKMAGCVPGNRPRTGQRQTGRGRKSPRETKGERKRNRETDRQLEREKEREREKEIQREREGERK